MRRLGVMSSYMKSQRLLKTNMIARCYRAMTVTCEFDHEQLTSKHTKEKPKADRKGKAGHIKCLLTFPAYTAETSA